MTKVNEYRGSPRPQMASSPKIAWHAAAFVGVPMWTKEPTEALHYQGYACLWDIDHFGNPVEVSFDSFMV